MELDAVVADINTVPEALRGAYIPQDGKYVLAVKGDLPGYVPAQKHAEFRENNVRLMKALGADSVDGAMSRAALLNGLDPAKLERLKAIDPDEYAALKAKASELETKSGKKDSEVDQLKGLLKQLGDRLDASETARKNAETQATERANEQALRDSISQRYLKAGGRPETLDFVLSKAKEVFKVDGGQVKADGKFNDKGDPLTPDEWIAARTKEWSWAFAPSTGGGAAPMTNGGAAGASRPGERVIVGRPQERLDYVPGKGLVDSQGRPVRIESA
jgi:hypothetical protein